MNMIDLQQLTPNLLNYSQTFSSFFKKWPAEAQQMLDYFAESDFRQFTLFRCLSLYVEEDLASVQFSTLLAQLRVLNQSVNDTWRFTDSSRYKNIDIGKIFGRQNKPIMRSASTASSNADTFCTATENDDISIKIASDNCTIGNLSNRKMSSSDSSTRKTSIPKVSFKAESIIGENSVSVAKNKSDLEVSKELSNTCKLSITNLHQRHLVQPNRSPAKSNMSTSKSHSDCQDKVLSNTKPKELNNKNIAASTTKNKTSQQECKQFTTKETVMANCQKEEANNEKIFIYGNKLKPETIVAKDQHRESDKKGTNLGYDLKMNKKCSTEEPVLKKDQIKEDVDTKQFDQKEELLRVPQDSAKTRGEAPFEKEENRPGRDDEFKRQNNNKKTSTNRSKFSQYYQTKNKRPIQQQQTKRNLQAIECRDVPKCLLSSNVEMECEVCYVRSPSEFYIRSYPSIVDDIEKELWSLLAPIRLRQRLMLANFKIDNYCCVRYNGKYRRGLILEQWVEDQTEKYCAKVKLIDHGHCENVYEDGIVALPERSASYQQQAVSCKLFGIRPVTRVWHQHVLIQFKKFCSSNKSFNLTVNTDLLTQDGSYTVSLANKNHDQNDDYSKFTDAKSFLLKSKSDLVKENLRLPAIHFFV